MLKEILTLLIITFLLFFTSCTSNDEIINSSNDQASDAKIDSLKYSLTITISPNNSGSVDVLDGFYEDGSSIELKGTSNSIYRFKEWQGDLLGNDNPKKILIDEDKTVTAVFEFNDLDKTYVPDDNFEGALIDLGYDDVLDDYVLTSSINSINALDVTRRNISDLKGIEDFIALESLQCSYNQLSVLDLNNNSELSSLYCSNNQLTELIVNRNINLEVIFLSNNNIETLDLSSNVSLQGLYADSNMLASIDLTNNPNLRILYCDYNQIQMIDLSNNIELTDFHCAFNKLSELDVRLNRQLIELKLLNNSISILDLSSNPNLQSLDCSYNQLNILNLKNGSNHEMPGLPQNPHDNFFGITFNDNPLLSCVMVDDVAAANNDEVPYKDWNKDETVVFVDACD